MTKSIPLTTPLKDKDLVKLKVGDLVRMNGVIYTARDQAHKRLVELINKGAELPIDLRGQVIYFVGPTPAKPGQPIGSAGPTTSGRMDVYSPRLMEKGLKGMIGKGKRSQAVIEAMKKHKCIYFVAVGGAGALLAQRIKKAEIVAYEDLGPEAIYRLEVENFPLIVANDVEGRDLFEEGVEKYKREQVTGDRKQV